MSYSHLSSANNLAQAAVFPTGLLQRPLYCSSSFQPDPPTATQICLFFNNFFLFVLCILVLCLQICLYEGTGYLGRGVQIVMECHVGTGN